MAIKQLIDEVLKKEGGYINHPADKGGPTKYGITRRTLETWRGVPVESRDIELLDKDEAAQIYEARYYIWPGIDKLPELIRPVVFDMAVNHGPIKAVELLQDTLIKMTGKKLVVDGWIGGHTMAAATIAVNVYGQDVVRQLCNRRAAFYHKLVENNPSQAVFLQGWLTRADSFRVG